MSGYEERFTWKFDGQPIDVAWYDSNRDWAALYVNGAKEWEGHPGDFEVGRWLELIAISNGMVITKDLMVEGDWLSAQNHGRFPQFEEEVTPRV